MPGRADIGMAAFFFAGLFALASQAYVLDATVGGWKLAGIGFCLGAILAIPLVRRMMRAVLPDTGRASTNRQKFERGVAFAAMVSAFGCFAIAALALANHRFPRTAVAASEHAGVLSKHVSRGKSRTPMLILRTSAGDHQFPVSWTLFETASPGATLELQRCEGFLGFTYFSYPGLSPSIPERMGFTGSSVSKQDTRTRPRCR